MKTFLTYFLIMIIVVALLPLDVYLAQLGASRFKGLSQSQFSPLAFSFLALIYGAKLSALVVFLEKRQQPSW